MFKKNNTALLSWGLVCTQLLQQLSSYTSPSLDMQTVAEGICCDSLQAFSTLLFSLQRWQAHQQLSYLTGTPPSAGRGAPFCSPVSTSGR